MKNMRFSLADILAVFLLILTIFLPTMPETKLNINVMIMLINCYLIGYISYLMSFMETKKVLAFLLPFIFYTGMIILFKNNFKMKFTRSMANDLINLTVNLFDVIFVSLVFFFVDLILNKIGGPRLAGAFAVLGLIIYLVMQNTDIIPFEIYYKDLFVYFSFFVMGQRVIQASSFNTLLYPLSIIIFLGEVILYKYIGYYPGIYFTLFVLTYFMLKGMENLEGMNFYRYLVFAFIFPYQLIKYILGSYISASSMVITIMAVLLTYIISQIFYRIRIKFLDYQFFGVH